jgi:membrane fusion protein (multidrug efflux system)
MYVRVRLEQAQAEAGIVVPQQAVTRGSTGDSVMVVGADGKAMARPVKVGLAVNGQWVVLDGLKAGEQVMVDGFQKLRGNAPVKAVPWQPAGSVPAASVSASAAVSAAVSASAPASAASAK